MKFKICTLLGRSDCGGEISEKPSLWGIEISPHGQFKLLGGILRKKEKSRLSIKVCLQENLVSSLKDLSKRNR